MPCLANDRATARGCHTRRHSASSSAGSSAARSSRAGGGGVAHGHGHGHWSAPIYDTTTRRRLFVHWSARSRLRTYACILVHYKLPVVVRCCPHENCRAAHTSDVTEMASLAETPSTVVCWLLPLCVWNAPVLYPRAYISCDVHIYTIGLKDA
jgi:hypothetical protein